MFSINRFIFICLRIEFNKQILFLLNNMIPECHDHFGWQEQDECQEWTKEQLDEIFDRVMINIFRSADSWIHCFCRRESFYYSISQISDEGRGKTKGRYACPILDARFKSQFLILHVNFFKSFNMLTHKAGIKEDRITFTLVYS